MIIRFILRAIFAGIGLWIASRYVHGIVVTSMAALIEAAVLLGIVNAIVRPIVFILTLPFVLVTFGLFLIIINALMLELVAVFIKGFSVDSFFWAAILGSLIISLVSWVGSWFIHQGDKGLA